MATKSAFDGFSQPGALALHFPYFDGDVPRNASFGVYIPELIRFARVCNHVADFKREMNVLQSHFSGRAIGIINFEKHFLNFNSNTTS